MTCSACGFEIPGDLKFCGECGTALVAGDQSPRTNVPKHLAEKILQSKSALEGERKQVTVLFADVKGSMELAEQLGRTRGFDTLAWLYDQHGWGLLWAARFADAERESERADVTDALEQRLPWPSSRPA